MQILHVKYILLFNFPALTGASCRPGRTVMDRILLKWEWLTRGERPSCFAL
jgi:hypothetical protein